MGISFFDDEIYIYIYILQVYFIKWANTNCVISQFIILLITYFMHYKYL